MADLTSSLARKTPIADQIAAAGIPDDHDAVLVTLKSDGHSRHSAGVAIRVANQWTLGATLEKEMRTRPNMTLTFGGSWKRR